jgi:hypothetical protein
VEGPGGDSGSIAVVQLSYSGELTVTVWRSCGNSAVFPGSGLEMSRVPLSTTECGSCLFGKAVEVAGLRTLLNKIILTYRFEIMDYARNCKYK